MPLPYFRTHLGTVAALRMPYLPATALNASPPASTSCTTLILNASLYRISSRIPVDLFVMPDNLFQDGTDLSGSPPLHAGCFGRKT